MMMERVDDIKRWSDLPNELLELIKKRLFYADQQNLREVCKSWSCIEEERFVPPLQQMPWLLVFFDETDSGKLVDPIYKKTYKVDMMKINRMRCPGSNRSMKIHESKYGWLLISFMDNIFYCEFSDQTNSTTLCLYSPFLDQDNNCIELPILNFNICMATFTSNPLDIEEEACTVVTLDVRTIYNTIIINTYRRGQSSWNKLTYKCDQFRLSCNRRWLCTDGCIFYYFSYDGRLGTFDLAREEWHVFPPLPTKMRERVLTNLQVARTINMVKSGGELFLILDWSRNKVQRGRYGVQYIYRLDLSSMIWENLNSIGERVLFYGDGYRSVLKSDGELKGISNTIYRCWHSNIKYCNVHDYTVRDSDKGFPQKHDCDRHYGSIAKEGFRKMLIDPPYLHH